MGFNRDDWDGPVPIEHHPMLSPELRRRLVEEIRRKRLEAEERRKVQRKRLSRLCFLLFAVALGVLIWMDGRAA